MRGLMTSRFASGRTFREGSVGLLLLLGLGVFGILLLWINRLNATSGTYKAIIEFANAGGMQKGTTVRYRGVKVGNISRIKPGANVIDVEIQIVQRDLIIPRNVVIEANQSGLISESIIDITPKTTLPTGATIAKPLDKNCDSSLIVCNGSRLKGQVGISVDELIRSSTELTNVYNNPKFYKNVNGVLEATTVAATSFTDLSQDLRGLTKSLRQQLNTFSATANSVQRATNQLNVSTTETVNEFGTTAIQANRLLKNLDNLLTTNRSSLVTALNNITETSNQLRVTVSSLSPAVNRFTQGELLNNLEALSNNAAQASANLRDATKTLNDPKNIVVLQQTLDSARVTFENTQKITSDLDELTGDPTFRQNLRQLVNGLSSLVSSTQNMQQQVQVATTLDSVKTVVNKPNNVIRTPVVIPEQISDGKPLFKSPLPNIEPQKNPQVYAVNQPPTFENSNNSQAITSPSIPNSSQENLLRQLREYGKQREQLKTEK
ncbi:MAG: MlaD family protein [Nostoc sp. ZfuVER08]|jgi:phospholipid/cholesterol/gamma-HCH transport system substrate-binding protein|uniref:MCE family protein n=1 Tax=Nostoc punctiforme FACHB-252 TaxID=1357509 RepID=A0ABR8H6C1_NOSPU|nr:MlaD family protein [Nostoc punctiforme]MBD2611298.1 MCE family protein [Nostoc punctiforme FACHB-252]MBL1199756.1 MCE family protein [Nostoc sp. GBBB01]MDZ8015490.1 MlaD family protein [Nostoc sp. ZfuVER08]